MANGNESMGPSHKEVGLATKKWTQPQRSGPSHKEVDPATKKWEPKHHDVLCSKHFEKNKNKKCFTDRTLLSIQFGLKYMSTG